MVSDLGFTEGPVITQAGEFVVTSIDRGCVYRVRDGEATVLAVTGGGPNGATEGPHDGVGPSIYVAQNGGTRPARRWPYVTGGIQVVRAGGRVDWVTQDPVSPNDLCFGPGGLLYLTDPTRGRSRRDDGRIWRCDPVSGEAELLCSVPWYPNGIAFGVDDDALFVASTGERRIVRFPLTPFGLGAPEDYVRIAAGLPDGFCFDDQGNLIVAAVGEGGRPGQIQTYGPTGVLVDVLEPGSSSKYTNVALSPAGTLLITDADGGSVLVVDDWPSSGLPLHPFRAGPSV